MSYSRIKEIIYTDCTGEFKLYIGVYINANCMVIILYKYLSYAVL
jgi:hypothetical protein